MMTFEHLLEQRYPKKDSDAVEDYCIYDSRFDLGIGDSVILNHLTREWTDKGFENNVVYRIISLEGGRYSWRNHVWDYNYHGFRLVRVSDNVELAPIIYFDRTARAYGNDNVITRVEDRVSHNKLAEPSKWLADTFSVSGGLSPIDLLAQLDLSDLTHKEQLTLLNTFTTQALEQVTKKREDTLIANFRQT